MSNVGDWVSGGRPNEYGDRIVKFKQERSVAQLYILDITVVTEDEFAN